MVSLTPTPAVSILLLVGLHGIFINKREITSPSTVLRCGIALEVCSLVNGWGLGCLSSYGGQHLMFFVLPLSCKTACTTNGIVQNERTHNGNRSWISEFRIRVIDLTPPDPDPGPQTQTSIPSSISIPYPIREWSSWSSQDWDRSPSSDYMSHHVNEYFHLPLLPPVSSSRQRLWLLVNRSFNAVLNSIVFKICCVETVESIIDCYHQCAISLRIEAARTVQYRWRQYYWLLRILKKVLKRSVKPWNQPPELVNIFLHLSAAEARKAALIQTSSRSAKYSSTSRAGARQLKLPRIAYESHLFDNSAICCKKGVLRETLWYSRQHL